MWRNVSRYWQRLRRRSRNPYSCCFRRQMIRAVSAGLVGARWRAGAGAFLVLTSIAGLGGCQSLWPFDSSAILLDNMQFMETWETYLHCRSSAQPDEIRADLQQLNRVAHAVTAQNQPSVLVPAAIRARLEAFPSRLAVDPRSMAAACALHGGHVALSAGQSELSVELFAVAGTAQEGSAYVSYAVEAERRFKHTEQK